MESMAGCFSTTFSWFTSYFLRIIIRSREKSRAANRWAHFMHLFKYRLNCISQPNPFCRKEPEFIGFSTVFPKECSTRTTRSSSVIDKDIIYIFESQFRRPNAPSSHPRMSLYIYMAIVNVCIDRRKTTVTSTSRTLNCFSIMTGEFISFYQNACILLSSMSAETQVYYVASTSV